MSSTLKQLDSSFNGFYVEADTTKIQQSDAQQHFSLFGRRQDKFPQQRIAKIQHKSWGIQVQKKRWEDSNSGFSQKIKQEQDNILYHFLELAEQASLETLLEQFKILFIQYNADKLEPDLKQSICYVVNQPQQFTDLVNDCCYIFINTCFKRKKLNHLQSLYELLQFEPKISADMSLLMRRFSHSLSCFQASKQFAQFQLFFLHQQAPSCHWSDRYVALKLLAIAHDPEVSSYQREASEKMHQALKNRYKFQLVMHLTKREKAQTPNPSLIHPTTLQILQKLITKQQRNYSQLATQFLEESHQLDFATFKEKLSVYLLPSIRGDRHLKWLPEKIDQHLLKLCPNKNNIQVGDHLITKTVDSLINYFINPKNIQDPTHPFTLLMIQQDSLFLSTLLLKLILISPRSYTKLLLSLNSLLTLSLETPQENSPWLISLLETTQVVFALAIHQPQSTHQ